MNRQELLDALRQRLSNLSESEVRRQLERFAEMIDDRVEMGMKETDAVAALGDPDKLIADSLLPAAAAPEAGDYGDFIDEIRIHMKNADVKVCAGILPKGMTARIEASERNVFTWSLENGMLTLTEAAENRRALFRRDSTLTLSLADMIDPEKLIADSYGGDLKIEGVSARQMVVLSTSTGDIKVKRLNCQGRAEITSRSGDIALTDVQILGDCKLENMSGDIEMKRLEAGSLRGRAASGDIEGATVRAGTVVFGTASGDIEIDDLSARPSIRCESISGDIQLSLTGGPYDLNGEEGVPVQLNTRSGEIKVKNNNV